MTAPLNTLEEEYKGVMGSLRPRADKQHFIVYDEPFVDNQSLSTNLSTYREQVVIFSYSGHAEQDGLIFDEEQAFVQGIAHLLGQCPNLKCVFLNGCSTQGQVSLMLEAGVPVVIATSAPVNDQIAAEFGKTFFQALANQETIGQAFNQAKGQALLSKPELAIPVQKDFVISREGNDTDLEASWGLFIHKDKEAALEFTLPNPEFVAKKTEFEPNKPLIDNLLASLAPTDPEVFALNTLETYNKEDFPFETRRKIILKSLPFPIKDHLRQLFATPYEGAGRGAVFYDKLDQARLDKLLATYETVIELTGFIMLAQLWKQLSPDKKAKKSANGVPKPETLKKFFGLNGEGEELDFIQLSRDAFDILKNYPENLFIDELDGQYMEAVPESLSSWQALEEKLLTLGTGLYDFMLDNADFEDTSSNPIEGLSEFLMKQEEHFFEGYNRLVEVRKKIRASTKEASPDISAAELEEQVQQKFLDSPERTQCVDGLKLRITEHSKVTSPSLDEDELEEKVDTLITYFTDLLAYHDERKHLISHQLLAEDSELIQAHNKLSELRKTNLEIRKAKTKQDEATLAFKCQETEEKLAILLRNLSFLSNYKLISVTDINVLKYRHSREADYHHNLAKLDRSEASNIELFLKKSIAMDCESVILISRRHENEFLNLSPFVIDEHAFIKKATEAKIRFFSHFGDDKYHYKYFSKPEDPVLEVESKTNHYRILKNQFKPYQYFTKA
ncbi:MAG: CHAT domain-containing protein [Bacteroidota bacterium]